MRDLLNSLISSSPTITEILKKIAANNEFRKFFGQESDLYQTWLPAAKRYIGGEDLAEVNVCIERLINAGHHISLEYMGGENTIDVLACESNTNNIIASLQILQHSDINRNVCFDLSSIGLDVSRNIAESNLIKIAAACQRHGCNTMISMEEYAKVDLILDIYNSVQKSYPNVGITLQAYLNRTDADLENVIKHAKVLRLVKGVYNTTDHYALARGAQLNEKYLSLVDRVLKTSKETKLFIATQDDAIIEKIITHYASASKAFYIEMLHGVKPDCMRKLRQKGFQTCVYVTYGKEWLIHFLHRLAEYPPNLVHAIADTLLKNQPLHQY